MARIVRREKRRRGFFGWLWLLAFVAFNGFMLFQVIKYWDSILPTGDHKRPGGALAFLSITAFLALGWLLGAVVLGTFALLTRGRTVLVEEIEDRAPATRRPSGHDRIEPPMT